MSITTPELLSAISDLSAIHDMRVAVGMSAKCGLIAGVATMVGGIVGGPPGIAIGGLLGTCVATYASKGTFKSATEIILNDTTPEQQEKLARALKSVLNSQNVFTLLQLAATIQSSEMLRTAIVGVVREFLQCDLGYQSII